MTGSNSVAAVVVTFNRKPLLEECLEALLHRTRPPDRIFVVDQGSTDGTLEMLGEKQFLSLPTIQYSRSDVNTGGAGGFCRGMQMAYEAGFGWIWLMDDDAIPDQDALRNMLPYTETSGVVAIANSKLRIDGSVDGRHIEYAAGERASNQGPTYLRYSSFVGLMISRSGIDRAGLPKSEFFFQQDDVEYCRRLGKAGKIVLAEDAPIVHKEAARIPPTARFFGRDFVVYPSPEFCIRHYFNRRNSVWTQLHGNNAGVRDVLRLIVQAINSACKIVIVDRKDVLVRLLIHYRALIDGVFGRFDNEFPFRMRDIVNAGHGAKRP